MNFCRVLFQTILFLFCSVQLAIPNASLQTNLEIAESIKKLDHVQDTTKAGLLLSISNELVNSQPREAFTYAREALSLSKTLKNRNLIGASNLALSRVYSATAVYDKALNHAFDALKEFEKTGNNNQKASCYEQIGLIHMLSGDFTQAGENYGKALEINKKTLNYRFISSNYMNMGLNYVQADSVDKGLSYFLVSLMIADSLNLQNEKVPLMKNIGYAYARLGKHEEALSHFYQVMKLLGNQPDDLTRSDAMLQIGSGYYKMKNYAAALKYARESYDLANAGHFAHIRRDASRLMGDIYAALGNFSDAYKYTTISRNIADTILNAEKAEQLARIQTIYEVNLKEEENVSLRKQIFRNIRQMRNRTLIIVVFTVLVIIMSILLFMLGRLNLRELAMNRKLAAQSRELESLNDLKDKFFSFVAHNLKNPFNTIMGFSELMYRAADAKDIGKVREYSGLIHNLSSQVQKVLANLLEWSRLQRRTFEVKPEVVEITGLMRDVAEMNYKETTRKDIHMTIQSDHSVFVSADRTMITTVIQNLVNNAIHFTPSSGFIKIRCVEKDGIAEMSIADNGCGISKDKQGQLFDFDFSQSNTGKSEHGAGLGLVISHEMLVKNGGTIRVDSDPGKGSTFTFTLPLATRPDHMSEHAHAEAGTTDIKNQLLSSESPLSAALKAEIKQKAVPLFEEVNIALTLENIETLAEALNSAGEKHNHQALAEFGATLKALVNEHQIDQIITILPSLGIFLKNNDLV